MKMNLGDLIAIRKVLDRYFNSDLKISAALKLSRVMDKLMPEVNKAAEFEKKIFDKYKSNSGKYKNQLPPGKKEKFLKERNELLELEIEIEFDPIKIKDFGEDFSIPPNQLNFLMKRNIIKE